MPLAAINNVCSRVVREQEGLGVGLELGLEMKANITNCFLLPAELSLFCCCPLEAEANRCRELALALGNVCRNSGWRMNIQKSLLCCKTSFRTLLTVLV